MSRAEAVVLLSRLAGLIADLRDLRLQDQTPQHVVQSAVDRINDIEEAAAEMRRIQGVAP